VPAVLAHTLTGGRIVQQGSQRRREFRRIRDLQCGALFQELPSNVFAVRI